MWTGYLSGGHQTRFSFGARHRRDSAASQKEEEKESANNGEKKEDNETSNGNGGQEDPDNETTKEEIKEYIGSDGILQRVGGITFEDGILGKGSYGTVRLGRRNVNERKAEHLVCPLPIFTDESQQEEELVAVKIFRKSTLKKMRTMERSKDSRRMQVKTAMMKVEKEIEIMEKLCHPNVAALFDVIAPDSSDMLYMVLEYMPLGEILTYQDDGTFRREGSTEGMTLVEPGNYFDEKTAALFFVDILHGLAYIHDNNVAHRDIKPENILLSQNAAGVPIAKLSDFGVAHLFEGPGYMDSLSSTSTPNSSSQLSPHGLVKEYSQRALSRSSSSDDHITKTEGTWCFWSPEMCQGKGPFSAFSADVWASGICLYVFVSGCLPYFSEAPVELMEMIADKEVPMDNLSVSDSLISLLKVVLAKDPLDRAGVGDCLSHPFLQEAIETRLGHLGDEFTMRQCIAPVTKDDSHHGHCVTS